MADRKLDIFRVLGAADDKKEDFFTTLTEDEQKELQPFLVARWMSGTFDSRQIFFINEFVNPYAFSLTKHKQLLWQLLTVANSGKDKRYVWNKLPSKRESGKPNAVRVIREYYNYSTRDAIDALELLNRDQVVYLAEQLGWQPEEITKVKRELKVEKDASDSTDSPKKKKKSSVDDLMEY